MEAPGWLAPASGAVAISTLVGLTAVYVVGLSVPVDHDVAVSAVVDAPADEVWALLSDPALYPKWRPRVVRVGQIADIDGKPTYRELDPGGDRFDFTVLEDARPTFVASAARPEDIGMSLTFTWTVTPEGDKTRVTLGEVGSVPNPFFRGMWWLRAGPYAGIEANVAAIGQAASGVPVTLVRTTE